MTGKLSLTYFFVLGLLAVHAISANNIYAYDNLTAKLSPVCISDKKDQTLQPKVRDVLFGFNIYEGFDIKRDKYDSHGWNGKHHIFYDMIEAIRPKLIVEVGTWKGQSAITMAKALKELNLSSEIVCVDTFLGSIDTMNMNSLANSDRKFGYPKVYEIFLNNVLCEDLQDYITPFPINSHVAYLWFKEHNISVDLVYLDASHDYKDVQSDIQDWVDVLKPGGVIIGDDYYDGYRADPCCEGVTKAVTEYRKSNSNIKFLGFDDGKWGFQKL